MERLSHKQYKQLLDFLAELHRPVPLAQFGRHLLNLTSTLLEGTTLAFDQIEPSSGYYSLEVKDEIDDEERLKVLNRLRDVYQQNPIYPYIQSGGTGAVDISSLLPRPAFERTEFFQDIFRPYDLKHQVCVVLPRKGWISTLTINCDRQIPARVLTLLSIAAHHMSLAHQTACQIDDLQRVNKEMLTPKSGLTARELEVFEWLGKGKRNSEIAIILGCSKRTVDKHVEHILKKTGAETRTAAVWGP